MRSHQKLKPISRILILAMFHLCWLTSYGYAEMVPTESAAQTQIQDDRQRLLDLLDRQEVIDELGKYGISKVEATARINSLTDEEVTKIAGKLDELLEGGYGVGPAVGFAYVAVLLLYVFILFPLSIILCPFSDKSYFDCISHYNSKFLSGINRAGEGQGDGYPDSSSGEEYCRSDCQSEFDNCMESVEGDKGETMECKDDQNTCDKKCSDWAKGFEASPGKSSGEEEFEENRFEKLLNPSSSKNIQTAAQCHSHCSTSYHNCINSGDGTVLWESQCSDEKQICSQQCDLQVRGKWCQDSETNKWILCEER
jgi:hypothetical protein